MKRALCLVIASCLAVGTSSCGKKKEETSNVTANNLADAANDATADANNAPDGGDAANNDIGGNDMPPSGGRVDIDLTAYADGNMFDDGQPVRVFQAEAASDLVDGEVAAGRVGDWVLDNGVARFIIEGEDRSMSVCPYGGHIVDGAPLDRENDGDTVGEVCLFVNAGSTMIPQTFEILSDGSDGVGVLAVTGPLVLDDWINFNTMAADLGFGAIGELKIGANRAPPVTATVYYILRAGERGLRSVAALRNDGTEQEHLFIGHLMGGGGDGSYFNPFSSIGGYGTAGLSVQAFSGEPMPFIAYGGGKRSSWAYAPKPNPEFDGQDVPFGGVYLAVSNIVVTGIDASNLLSIIVTTDEMLPVHPQLEHPMPGEIVTKEHWFFVGDGSMATMLDQLYPSVLGVDVGTVSGTITDATGAPADGARVTALDASGRPLSQFITDSTGAYTMSIPVGDYTISARIGNVAATPVDATVTAAAELGNVDLVLAAGSMVTVNITDPSGTPVPGRVTVICDDDPCPGKPGQAEVDTATDKLPATWAGIYYADVATGQAAFELPPGSYRVVVTRGMAWSAWPSDGIPNGGFQFDVVAGQDQVIDAEIAEVVDMSNLLYSDFHVHTLSSHDSSTPHIDRIHGFVADDMDVAVSSDHDFVADYGPAVAALGAQEYIATVVGLEITASDLGHYNAFPLQADPAHKRGGALDWAGGDDLGLLPADLFAWIDNNPGEQVVQVNHADSLGFIKSTLGDPLRAISLADPSTMRLPPSDPDPVTGDTGLWTDDFTAYEVSNGNDLPQFWTLFRWWLTMIGRGFAPTGTSVTDTHRRWSDVGSTPRSIVVMPDGMDTPETFDEAAFVTAVNAGRVVGTNGPTLRVSIDNMNGDSASYGETIDGSGGEVTAVINIQMPEWMRVDTIEAFSNLDTVITPPGEPNEDPVAPSASFPVDINGGDFVTVETGMQTHRRIDKTIQIPLTITQDSYFVFVVRGVNTESLVPYLHEEETRTFSFTNPIFVDFDGNGYDNPPLADLAQTPPPPPPVRPGPRPDVDLTVDDVMRSFEANTCSEHDHAH